LYLIERHGADGVRVGMLLSSPAGNDLLFDEKLCEQGRNFSNKIWNAFRLVSGWEVNASLSGKDNETAIKWFDARFNVVLEEIEDHFSKYRLSDALMAIYKLVWDDFCSWYLEMIKPAFEQPIDKETYEATINFFEKILKVIHPFMPFISEELWHEIKQRKEKEAIIIAEWPKLTASDKGIIAHMDTIIEVITNIRNTRNSKQIAKNKALELEIKTEEKALFERFSPIIKKLAGISSISFTQNKPEGSVSFVVKASEFFIPLKGELDTEKEKDIILKEIEYAKGFLVSVEKKLGNERFVAGAPPEVLENEKKKKADAEAKIKALEQSLAELI